VVISLRAASLRMKFARSHTIATSIATHPGANGHGENSSTSNVTNASSDAKRASACA
jgi:hypothetical protein